jgi:4-alpha-glucanotransferase
MNQPGSAEGNWRWRCTETMLSASAFQSLRDLTHASGRSSGLETLPTDASMATRR